MTPYPGTTPAAAATAAAPPMRTHRNAPPEIITKPCHTSESESVCSEGDALCPICLETGTCRAAIIAPCFHTVDDECLYHWIAWQGPTMTNWTIGRIECPVCRREIQYAYAGDWLWSRENSVAILREWMEEIEDDWDVEGEDDENEDMEIKDDEDDETEEEDDKTDDDDDDDMEIENGDDDDENVDDNDDETEDNTEEEDNAALRNEDLS